jgi:type IV fimbrial biogenesis protein FimT
MKETGFTLTELLVVTAIVAILLGIGVPSYRYITNSYRMSSEVNGLLGDLQFARAEAIKEGQTVTTCVSADSATCTGGATWQNGWIVFSNPPPLAANPATPAAILRVQNPFAGSVPDSFVAANNITAITFNREGFATAAGFLDTTIVLKEQTLSSAWTRCLRISAVGLMATETYDPSVGCQ